MYLDYWRLASKPFEPGSLGPTGDADWYYPCESHEGALSKLRYAAEGGRGAAALAGPSGVGKSLIISRLAAQVAGPQRPVVRLAFPQMSGRDVLVYLAEKLGAPALPNGTGSVEESVRRLEGLAEAGAASGQQPLVVIDEAHLLEDAGVFETLRLLMNFESAGRPAWTLLLVGQMGLLSGVSRWPNLDERLAVKTLVRGFTADETAEYVTQRLFAAGASRELFSQAAMQRLHALAGGVARRINRLADLSLVVGMAEGVAEIGAAQLEAVHRELVTVGS
ncbi:MAG: ExeA family protein [Lacipirellulaceae bacterium]